MGFDPRRWRPSPSGPPLTTNVEALLAENDSLRRQVRSLTLQLELLLQDRGGTAAAPPRSSSPGGRSPSAASGPTAEPRWQGRRQRMAENPSHGLTAELLARWGEALARHPRWLQLRLGPPGGLRTLLEQLQRHSWNPALSLEEDLNRRSPGLGSELADALRGPPSRLRLALRCAFALYGPSAPEWLTEDPQRVVAELLRRLEQLERGTQGRQRRSGTRTANHTQAAAGERSQAGGARREGAAQPGEGGGPGPQHGDGGAGDAAAGRGSERAADADRERRRQGRDQGDRRAGERSSPRRDALRLLELEEDADPQQIRRAYRRLAKIHHPDLGGDDAAFRRLDAAYRLLCARDSCAGVPR